MLERSRVAIKLDRY